MNTVRERTRAVREAALELGFDRCEAAPVGALDASPRLREWLALGMHGSMQWMARSAERRADPGLVVPEARSVLIVTRSYWTGEDANTDPARARISRYAWGAEYHNVLGAALRDLYQRIAEIAPGVAGRYYVDTGPVLEKAWAEIRALIDANDDGAGGSGAGGSGAGGSGGGDGGGGGGDEASVAAAAMDIS